MPLIPKLWGFSQQSSLTAERQPLLQDDSTGSDQQPAAICNTRSPADPGRTPALAVPEQSSASRQAIRLKVLSVVFCFFSVGINTASIGALIPLLESHYSIRDARVALIFVVSVAGYLTATLILDKVHIRFGRRGIAILDGSFHIIQAVVLSFQPPYLVALAAYWCFGFGTGFTDVGWNAWAANVPNMSFVQGIIHGSYSVGCILGPTIVAALSSAGWEWNAFYYVMIVTSCLETGILLWAFRRDDGAAYRSARLDVSEQGIRAVEGKRPIWFCSLFYLLYVGIETSLSGWLVTYMSRSRHTTPYVAALATSLFWTGMAIGRFTLGPFTMVGGLRLMVIVFICFSICLQLLFRIKQLPVAVSLSLSAGLGFSLGPMFPSGIVMLTRSLPTSAHVNAVAFAAAIGQIGGAAAPFLLGLVAETSGIERLFDMVLGLTMLLLVVWTAFARAPKVVSQAS